MDWAGLMRLGLSELRLSPAVFWSLTPLELAMIAGREPGQGPDRGPMTRQALMELAQSYPDKMGGAEDGR
ncbi:MAG: rcc01693 family protein [Pseudomonadota bacterium]